MSKSSLMSLRRLIFPFFASLVAFAGLETKALAQNDSSYAGKIGVNMDGVGGRAKQFVDVARTLSNWERPGGTERAPVDEHGWPTSDGKTLLFDIRPFGTWRPPADDPDKFQPDWSGTYKMSFKGQAVIQFIEGPDLQVQNQKYDPATNLTTADLVVPKGVGLLVLSFTQTKRTADSPTGSGLTNLRVLRPGYGLDTTALFTDEFLKSLKPFAALRFMDWLETNHNPGFYGDPGHHVLNWADRRLFDDATQRSFGNKYGAAWESVIALAKATGKDIWINIPVAATDDYVKNLAQLLKQQLPPKCNIYIEHSNEVWNFGMAQYVYNKLAAADEVKQGNSILNKDGEKDPEIWARRRHAKRLVEIGNIFRDTFGPADASRIRPVFASWEAYIHPFFADMLAWVEKTYGPPRNYFYAVAGAAYYTVGKAPKDADVPGLLKGIRDNSDENLKNRAQLQEVANQYGLKHFQYETGPDVSSSKHILANLIRASRDPAMKDLIVHDARDNWFPHGGDLYMYYSLCTPSSRYGCWGLSEDIANLNTPKWQAIYELTGASPPQ